MKQTKENAINQFSTLIANAEGGKSNTKVGDVRQVLKMADKALGGALYALIRLKYETPVDNEIIEG